MKWPFVSRARLESELAKQEFLHSQDYALLEKGIGAELVAEREAHAATRAELEEQRQRAEDLDRKLADYHLVASEMEDVISGARVALRRAGYGKFAPGGEVHRG